MDKPGWDACKTFAVRHFSKLSLRINRRDNCYQSTIDTNTFISKWLSKHGRLREQSDDLRLLDLGMPHSWSNTKRLSSNFGDESVRIYLMS